MRLPLAWLQDYVRPELDTAALVDRLDMTGTAVEHVLAYGVSGVEHFVVGKVLSAEQHPDADRLRVCLVDVGDGGEPKQIVCGAPNVAAGQTVAVARPGAVMPDGTKLKAAKLRGVVSDGMILAEDELGLGSDHAGIMELDDSLEAGTPLADVLPIATEVLELEITPNRPDCLGVYGVAREVHAITGAALAKPPWAKDPHPAGATIDGVSVAVDCPELCPRFTIRAFDDVRVGPSPLWLKGRLAAAGVRSISNVVDITNYVMLLTGQPMHAFDADRVSGGRLTVRLAADGETIDTLDGQTRSLTAGMVVIEDADGPTSIAGVMGGARSEVDGDTTRVLIEAATWDGPNINRTSSALGLRSEASGRFEKGLSPQQTLEAQAVASALMIELCGARPVDGTVDIGADPDPARPQAPILLRDERIEALLGVAIPRRRQIEILTSLGFFTTPGDDGLAVGVPHWRRRDITREADLIEEVARVHGVETLPSTLPPRRRLRAARLTHAQSVRRRAEDTLVGRGLLEVAGWSFTEPSVFDRLQLPPGDHHREHVALVNPMSETQSILRTVQLPSLLDAARHNLARGATDIGVFESAAVYRPAGADAAAPATEVHVLGALLIGALPGTASWRDGARAARGADAPAAKGMLAAVLDALRVDWSVETGTEAFLHPGRAGHVHAAGRRIGWVGEVHPLVARAWEIDRTAAAFAVDLGLLASLAPEVAAYRDLTSFPVLREDVAIVVGADLPAGRVLDVAREAGGKLLTGVEVFDVFAGEELNPPRPGTVSLALHLEFRAEDRTLADTDVAPVREKIVAHLRDELGGELRG